MELLFATYTVISFIACVYAYLTGVKHGMRVSARSVPRPIKEVVEAIKSNTIAQEDTEVKDLMQQILSYDYETALRATEQRRMGAAE